MKNVTVVDSTKWLLQLCSPILLSYSKPVEDRGVPSPQLTLAKLMAKNLKCSLLSYDDATVDDKGNSGLFGFSQISFGRQKWQLGLQRVALRTVQTYLALEGKQMDPDTYYSYFACKLLEGKVCKMSALKFPPDRVLHGVDLTPKVTRLISALRRHQVDSWAKLATVWSESDPNFLREELQMWAKGPLTWPLQRQ